MDATKTAVMTGASRGLGWHAAVTMLKQDPELHLVVTTRSATNGSVAETLSAASGNPHVSEVDCDLASLRGVCAAADAVRLRTTSGEMPPVGMVVANAGLQLTTATKTSADGIELTFAVNVLANIALVQGLIPAMTTPGRIVITGSDTHFGTFRHTLGMVAGPQWREPEDLCRPAVDGDSSGGQIAYSTSKLAVIYVVHALARRLPAGLDVYTFNPGLVPGTDLARDRNRLSRIGWKAVMPVLSLTPLAMSATKAGRLLAHAATGPRPAETGAYIDRDHVTESSNASYDLAREEKLWNEATAILDRHSPRHR